MPERIYTTPLAQKLGVIPAKPRPTHVVLIAPAPELPDLLGDLPPTTTLATRFALNTTLALCFVRRATEIEPAFDLLSTQLPAKASAWIIYPKARLKPGFTENTVRETGLAAGFVDYKICSVSDAWSGVKFTRRQRSSNSPPG